jgi:hypothetical protein
MKKLVETIKTALVPEFRAIATAASFQQMFAACPELTEGSLSLALSILAITKEENEPIPTTERRETCAEISALCNPIGGSIENAVTAWGNWVDVLTSQSTIVPPDAQGRILGMLATAKRELAELQKQNA